MSERPDTIDKLCQQVARLERIVRALHQHYCEHEHEIAEGLCGSAFGDGEVCGPPRVKTAPTEYVETKPAVYGFLGLLPTDAFKD